MVRGGPGSDENSPKFSPHDPDFEPITGEEIEDGFDAMRYKRILDGDASALPDDFADVARLEAAYKRDLAREADRRLKDARREIAQRGERLQSERLRPDESASGDQ